VLSSSLVLAKSPRQIGTLQGLFMQCANLAQFVGPPMIAALVASSGHWSDALYVTGSAAVTGILLGLAIKRIEARREG
jgi:MFS transporter, CP family, cyanate transporter